MNYARFMAHFNDRKCGFISEDVKQTRMVYCCIPSHGNI